MSDINGISMGYVKCLIAADSIESVRGTAVPRPEPLLSGNHNYQTLMTYPLICHRCFRWEYPHIVDR